MTVNWKTIAKAKVKRMKNIRIIQRYLKTVLFFFVCLFFMPFYMCFGTIKSLFLLYLHIFIYPALANLHDY